jgi:eukaryotic-like serine/threonine-protein kinase
MTQFERINKISDSSFASHVNWRNQEGIALPQDLMKEASSRLKMVSLVYAVTYFMAYFAAGLANAKNQDLVEFLFLRGVSQVAWLAILGALALYLVARSNLLSPEKLLDLGQLFLVLGALGIAGPNFWGVYPDGPPDFTFRKTFIGVPWEAVWIMIYPVIIPNCPKKTLMVSLLAATTAPVVTSISIWAGATSSDIGHLFFWRYFLFTNYLCALLAWFSSSYIHKLGRYILRAREIGSYKLISPLGAGGMGEIWLAEHKLLARPSALKIIKPEILGADAGARTEALARFEREAQATASLSSPHTIRVYDFGSTPEGSFFYVMELLQGIGLDTLVQKYGPQPPERVVFLMRQACHSLQDAHASGMVHRDIKPGNIFLCRLGQDHDYIKVLDFGLVKSTAPDRPGDLALTNPAITAGTPGFLSPESALSRSDIDGRSDLYSLGCVAYWLLTGVTVFEGENALETAAMHLKDQPIPPSQRSEFDIAAPLEEIILQCLAKKPDDRPASADDLDTLLANCTLDKTWDKNTARNWWEMHTPV